jgi:hypothetical protein
VKKRNLFANAFQKKAENQKLKAETEKLKERKLEAE